jgi:RNA-directed DNA polymerase
MALNSDMPWPSVEDAKLRVLDIQRKLHQWSKADGEKRFHDLFNLVCDRAALVVAWNRVRSNRGSKTAGVDGATRWHLEHRLGVAPFLEEILSSLKARTYRPLPVREHGIPKAAGKTRYLGIPTIRDRVVQMALKLVLEPIFETDFYPSSYGYRPARRAQDAIAEIALFLGPRAAYEYAVEGDIKACFDNVHHGVLMTAVRRRIGDRKVLALVKAFLGARVLKENGRLETPLTGTPQGGIISPLLANVYLSAMDRHFERSWQHQTRYIGCTTYYRRKGHATYRLVRYADDFVILVRGSREQAEAIRDEAARVLKDGIRSTKRVPRSAWISRASAARGEREASEGVGVEQGLDAFEGAGLIPVEGSEVEQTVLGPTREQAEDVAQVRPWLDIAESAAREQRGEEGIDGAGVVAADKEPVFTADRFPT